MVPIRLLNLVIGIVMLLAGRQALAHPEHMPLLAAAVNEESVTEKSLTEELVDQQIFSYYFYLFTDLARACPTSLQQETIDQATAVYPYLGQSAGPASLAQEAKAFYERLRGQYAIVRVIWDNNKAQLVEGHKPVGVTRGVERHVLVEVHNQTDVPLRLFPAFEGNSSSPVSPTFIPAGSMRAFATPLLVAQNANPSSVGLRLVARDDAPETRIVAVPVKVSQPATIRGTLIDAETNKMWPGRVYVKCSDHIYRHGKAFANNTTLSEKQLLQFPRIPKFYKLPFFYSDGTFEIDVPPGVTEITLERGFEHEIVRETIDVKPGEVREVTLRSGRFINMKKLGWISGDTHIHWVKNNWYENEDLDLLAMVQRAEDLRVANNLTLLHRTAHQAFIAPSHFPMGPVPGYCDSEYHIQMAEEYRNEGFYGHLCLLNLKRLILPISTGKGMAGPDAIDYPINKTAILDCRSQGGISVEAHGLGLNWDVPVNVIHNLTDSLDQIKPEHYYRFLDCGFRLPITNGSDHPARVAGSARAYVKVDGGFTYENWIDGIRKDRTFTTSGPLLFLNVNEADIGDELRVGKGQTLHVTAKVLSRHPVGNFQVVSNGEVIRQMKVAGTEAEMSFDIPAEKSRWFVARCSRNDNYSAITAPDIAHTSAIYVTVDNQPIFRPEAARFWAERMKEHSADVAKRGRFANDQQRREAVGYIDSGVRLFEEMLRQSGQQKTADRRQSRERK